MRKGQASMEFTMVYGIALLAVLGAISLFYAYGFLSPVRYLPERCALQTGLTCIDAQITNDSVSMLVQNDLGTPIEIQAASFQMNGYTCGYAGPPIVLGAGERTIIQNTQRCLLITKGDRAKITPTITYQSTDGVYAKSIDGEIIARI